MASYRPLQAAVVAVLLTLASAPNSVARSEYRAATSVSFQFSIDGQPVKTGKLWLFYFRWGSRDIHCLGEIHNGRVTISVEPEVWFAEYEPKGFAIVVEVPGAGWYRTPD